ncbi:MAG: IclR family transcriptional regulator domain-containing protein, partial [Sciscionella sp.]
VLDEQDALLKQPLRQYTKYTVVEPRALRRDLDTILRDGYAVCYEELEIGLNAAAVPVHTYDGRVVAALSASGPSYRCSRKRIPELVSAMQDAVEELSGQLGYLGS